MPGVAEGFARRLAFQEAGGIGRRLAEELEALVERDGLLDRASLGEMIARIEDEADGSAGALLGELAQIFRALVVRLDLEPLNLTARRDLEALLYPRLWKILEAVIEDLPAGEQRIRIQVTGRRLARLLAEEAATQ